MKLVKRKLKKYDFGGYLNTAMSLGSDIYSVSQPDEYSKNNAKGSLIGGIAGGAIGTFIAPGVGTTLGYSLGSSVGGMVGSHYDDNNFEANQTKERSDLLNINSSMNYQANKATNSGGLGYFKKGGKLKGGCGCGMKMKCGGKLHKMALGGDPPKGNTMYVDPNDPKGRVRYQAYQDSLNAYNTNKNLRLAWEKDDLDYFNRKYANNQGVVKREVLNQGASLVYPTQYNDKGQEVKPWENKSNNIAPFAIGRSTLYLNGRVVASPGGVNAVVEYPIYKKPEQPVKYKPNPEIVAKQQQLIDAGYDIGKADGIWGPKSKEAWEKMQKENNNKVIENKNPIKEEKNTTNTVQIDVSDISWKSWNEYNKANKSAMNFSDYKKGVLNGTIPYSKKKYGGRLFKYGGEITPEYEAEQGEVITGTDTQLEDGTQLASDVMRVDGNTHENGGTAGAGGDFVYSDSIPLSDTIKQLIGKFISGANTYAQAAEKIGKQKGKFEEKILSANPLEAETGKAMLGKLDSFLEILAQDQELLKGESEMGTGMQLMKYGGRLRKMNLGGPPFAPYRTYRGNANMPFNAQTTPTNTLSPAANAGLEYWKEDRYKNFNVANYPPSNTSNNTRNTRVTPRQTTTGLVNPIVVPERDIMNPNEFNTGNVITGLGEPDITYQPFGKENYTRTAYPTLEAEPPASTPSWRDNLNSPYMQANLANAANYAVNLGTINRIKNYERPSLMPIRQQRFYRDNRNVAGINNSFATMVREGLNPTLLSQLYGTSVRNIGDANTQQNMIENSIRNSNIQAMNVADSNNTQLMNNYRMSLIDTYNKKIADRLNARNAATQGYMANIYGERQEEAEMDRMAMKMLADPTGATEAYTDRVINSPLFSPYFKSKFNRINPYKE